MTLVLLTGTVVLGIATSLRWEGRSTPRFLTASVHRNVSLFTIVLLAVHIATAVLDPYAGIRIPDALIPFSATYRPLWLGLGVIAAEVFAAIALTSLARGRLGPRWWRVIHWTAYACWPLALVHGLGTGSDAQEPWLIGLSVACMTAVLLVAVVRLLSGRWRTAPVRLLAAVVAGVSLVAVCSWTLRGPLQPGWAASAGTPSTILSRGSGSQPGVVRRGRSGFADGLVGVAVQTPAGAEIGLRDVVDPALTFTIMPPSPTQTQPEVTVERNNRPVCSTPARVVKTIYAVCGSTRLVIELFGTTGRLTGRLITSGPLG